jgi:hypothetical protein
LFELLVELRLRGRHRAQPERRRCRDRRRGRLHLDADARVEGHDPALDEHRPHRHARDDQQPAGRVRPDREVHESHARLSSGVELQVLGEGPGALLGAVADDEEQDAAGT